MLALLVDLDGEGGIVFGVGFAIAVDRKPAFGDTQVHRAGVEIEVQVVAGGHHANRGAGAAGAVRRDFHAALDLNVGEGFGLRGVGQFDLLARKQLHIDAGVFAELVSQGHNGGLTTAIELVRAMVQVFVVGFGVEVDDADHGGLDALHSGAGSSNPGFEVRQNFGVFAVADRAATLGKCNTAKSSGRGLLDARGVVVVQEDIGFAIGIADAGIDLQIGHGRQVDAARPRDIQQIGDEIQAHQRCAGHLGQLGQVQIEGVFLRKHHAQIKVHVQRVARQGQREDLVLGSFGVVVMHAQSRLNQLLDLADGRRGILRRLLDLGEEVVHKREHILQRAANHRQLHAVEGLAGDGITDKLKACSNAADDVFETQVLEVEHLAQVRQDHNDGIGLDLARKHQGLNIGRVHRVLVDHFDRARVEGIQCLNGHFNVRGQRNVRSHAHVHTQTTQSGIGLALEIELEVVGAEFREAETSV